MSTLLRFTTLRKASLFVLVFLCCGAGLARASAYTTYPTDTLKFTPTGQGTMTSYIRVSYSGDTTGPGDHIRAAITSGSSYFSISVDSIFTKSYYYWTITYTIQSTAVTGSITFTDDTTTRVIVLMGGAGPDGSISTYGPYYNNVPRGATNCEPLRMINTGSDVDTITSVAWSHSNGGLLIWDSSLTFPHVLGSHDTLNWNICFHAGTDTNVHLDTLLVYYKDAYSSTRYFTRIVSAQAHDTSSPDGVLSSSGPYWTGSVPKGATSCTNLRMINTGADVDTLISASWAHSTGGIFTWDSSVTFPHTMASHDTVNWSFCFHAPNDTNIYVDTLHVVYHDAYNQTRYITRIVYARAVDTTSPDGALVWVGPYWTATVPEGGTSCTYMRVINNGADVDTIVSVAWTHDPSGMFVIDSSFSTPAVLGSHDTMYVNACFHAPYDTLRHWDTLVVHYHDAYSQSRYLTRIVSGQATDTSIRTCYGLYVPSIALTEVGDTSSFRLYISNQLDSSASLTGIHFSGSGDASFRVDSSTFPRTIAAHAYDSLWLKFVPQTSTSTTYTSVMTVTFTTNDTAHCHTASTTVTGHSALAARDTASVSLTDTTTKHIALVSDTSVNYYSHRVNVVNSTGSRIRIDTAYLTNTNHIYIAQQIHSKFPDTLVDGAWHSVIIHFYGDSSHTVYHDTLVVTMENALMAYYFFVDGISTASTSGVLTLTRSAATDIRIYPNPSSGFANIQPVGLSSVTYDVLDILGNVVAQHTGAAEWQWNPGSEANDGTYFVRATGRDADGHVVVVTRRFALKH